MRKTDWAFKFSGWAHLWFARGAAHGEMEVHGNLFYESIPRMYDPKGLGDIMINEEEVAAKMAERLDDGYPYQFCRAP